MAIHQVAIEQIASPTEFKRPLLIDTDYLTNQWAVIVTCKRGAAQPREIQRGLDAGVEGDEALFQSTPRRAAFRKQNHQGTS